MSDPSAASGPGRPSRASGPGGPGSALGELLTMLLEQDVQIAVDGDELRYDAPVEVVTDELIARLRRGKPALRDWLAAAPTGAPVQCRALPPYNQQELWARASASPYPAVYTISQRLRLHGELSPTALTTALEWLTGRHPPLRTRFRTFPTSAGEQPVLEVLASVPVRLPVTDLSGMSEPDRGVRLEALCRQQLQTPIDLATAPLWRGSLFRLGPAEHVLLWTVHHVICDGWSFRQLMAEWFAQYQRVLTGQGPADTGAGPTHLDYARHQRRLLAGPARQRLFGYWRQALSGAQLKLALPYDRPASTTRTWQGEITEFRLGADELDRLRQAARAIDATLYLLLLSAYALAIARLTGQSDLVFPTSYAGRGEPGYESVVGLLADRLPIRVRLPEVQTFADLVAQVGRSVFAALDHALPLCLITECLPASQRPPAPYPTALFTLIEGKRPEQQPELPGVRIEPEPADPTGIARMDLYCFLTTGPAGLHGAFEFAVDRFTAATVDQFADNFVILLRAVATDPKMPLDLR